MDQGHAVVLDGLCSERERVEILDWLTAEGHDHSGPPPGEKWELACVDRVGDQPTWGLRPEVLEVSGKFQRECCASVCFVADAEEKSRSLSLSPPPTSLGHRELSPLQQPPTFLVPSCPPALRLCFSNRQRPSLPCSPGWPSSTRSGTFATCPRASSPRQSPGGGFRGQAATEEEEEEEEEERGTAARGLRTRRRRLRRRTSALSSGTR